MNLTQQKSKWASEKNGGHWLWLACFAGLTFFVYAPAHGSGWFFDDYRIIDMPLLTDPLSALSELLSPRGLSFLSFSVDFWLWGLNPTLSRWVNVALHLTNSLLVVVLVRQLTGAKARWAYLLGLLFLCHPAQTAAVNYITQRMTLLSSLFALSAVILMDQYFQKRAQGEPRKGIGLLFFSLLCGILSILSKENTVLLPLVVPLLAWLRGGGKLSMGWPQATALWCLVPIVAVLVRPTLNLDVTPNFYQDTGQEFYQGFLDDLSWLNLRYFLSQLEVFWVYLGLVFLPLWQGFDYCWPIPDLTISLTHIITLALLTGLFFIVFQNRRRYPLTFFGTLWVVIFMGVESSFIVLDPIFVHRLYLALVGVSLIVYEQASKRTGEKFAQTGLVLLLVLWSGLAWQRSSEWRDPVKFWTASSRVAPRALRPHLNLAVVLFDTQRYVEVAQMLKERHAATSTPSIQIILGEALFFAGQRAEATQIFSKVAQEIPAFPNLELFEAYIAIEKGDWAEAEKWLARSESKNSRNVLGLYLRGWLEECRQQYLSSAQFYRKAIDTPRELAMSFDSTYRSWASARLKGVLVFLAEPLAKERAVIEARPQDFNLRANFANKLLSIGEVEEAISHYHQLKRTAPPTWILPYNLGIAYEKSRRYKLALACYMESLRIEPDQPLALYNYAHLLRRYGKVEEALQSFSTLLQKTPNDSRVWLNYAELLENKKEYEKAKAAFEMVAKLPGHQLHAKQGLWRLSRFL